MPDTPELQAAFGQRRVITGVVAPRDCNDSPLPDHLDLVNANHVERDRA